MRTVMRNPRNEKKNVYFLVWLSAIQRSNFSGRVNDHCKAINQSTKSGIGLTLEFLFVRAQGYISYRSSLWVTLLYLPCCDQKQLRLSILSLALFLNLFKLRNWTIHNLVPFYFTQSLIFPLSLYIHLARL